MVIWLEWGADLHMAQQIPLLLIVSCFSKIQIVFTFLVLAHPGSPGQGPLNGCVCVWLTPRIPLWNTAIKLIISCPWVDSSVSEMSCPPAVCKLCYVIWPVSEFVCQRVVPLPIKLTLSYLVSVNCGGEWCHISIWRLLCCTAVHMRSDGARCGN